jgi:hypothetical protein
MDEASKTLALYPELLGGVLVGRVLDIGVMLTPRQRMPSFLM